MHTYIIETQLYNKMCLSSGTLIIDMCIRWHLFDVCLIFVVLCTERAGSSKARIQYVIMCIVRDTMTKTRYVLFITCTQPLKLVTSPIGVPDLIRKPDISLRMKHIDLYINFNTLKLYTDGPAGTLIESDSTIFCMCITVFS